MKPHIGLFYAALAAATAPGRTAHAAETVQSDSPPATLGMDPQIPAQQALPGGTTPLMGEPAGADWRFDFHGTLTAPLRVGFNDRPDARPGQSKLVLHTPPVVPDDLETFSHTGVVPTPYGQLNFSYGNDVVTGTASIVATVPNVSSGFYDPQAQPGVYDLFVTVRPKLGDNVRLTFNVGAFTNRYGVAGEYDEGRYGTPFIARLNAVGEHVTAGIAFDDWTVLLEQGIAGQSNKASTQITPEGWNAFADPREGSSFVSHFHAGLGYKRKATLGRPISQFDLELVDHLAVIDQLHAHLATSGFHRQVDVAMLDQQFASSRSVTLRPIALLDLVDIDMPPAPLTVINDLDDRCLS